MESTQTKTAVSIILLLVCCGSVLMLASDVEPVTFQSQGLILDFAEYDTEWTDVDLGSFRDAESVLEYICTKKGYSLSLSEDGSVIEIKGIRSDAVHSWRLWAVEKGSTEWILLEAPYTHDLSQYTVSAFAYRAPGEEPTVAVDSVGSSVYGFSQKSRIITLSPSITEIAASLGAVGSIIGTDSFSNYPYEVVRMQQTGKIAIVGDYTTPSYEAIINAEPDAVLCDGTQYNHIQLASRLMTADVCAVVLYDGEDVDSINDNIFIVSHIIGYDMAAAEVLDELTDAMDLLTDMVESSGEALHPDTVVSLSGDMSPWVSGDYTYMSDILLRMYGVNLFDDYVSWVHINSEQILSRNPSKIIILTTEYEATQTDYDYLLSSLSDEWKSTDAYRTGEIYLITESAGDMAQRPGPRYAQLAELVARILNPDVFDDLKIEKYIGDDYTDYLTYTKDLGYEG